MQNTNNNPVDEKPATETSPVQRLFSILLIVSGGLIAATAGICSIVVVALDNGIATSMESLMLVAIVGGIPLVVGILLFKWGQSLGKAKTAPDVSQESSQ